MAINFKLTDVRTDIDAEDPMARTWVGYDPGRLPEELFEQNRGIWLLGRRADDERFATFSHDGRIVIVAQIDGIELRPWADARGRRDKKAVVGHVLGPGDRAYDHFIGQTVAGHRNPVSYVDDPEPRPKPDANLCACGCGSSVSSEKHFVAGHDQRAVRERITRQWGDTIGFVDWFDATFPAA